MNNVSLPTNFEELSLLRVMHERRKTLYKEVLKTNAKSDSKIKIGGAPVDDTIASCNAVNENFYSASEKLATSIISVHAYG